MKDVFRVYLGSPEKSIWPDAYFVFDDMEVALEAFEQMVERKDWLGKKVFAKLSFNSTVACLHRFDARTLHANNVCGQGDFVRAQLEMAMVHHKECRRM